VPPISYFAYGSNMLTRRLLKRCPSAAPRQVACVDQRSINFLKKSDDGSGKATLASAIGDRAFGVIFDLDRSDLPELDRFEGAGRGYDRVDDFAVRIVGSHEPITAVSYLANPSFIVPGLRPYDWYLDLVIAGACEHKLPPDYIARLKTTPARTDPVADRQSRLKALALLEGLPGCPT
jgi:gamma-glutamylcyclotransferase